MQRYRLGSVMERFVYHYEEKVKAHLVSIGVDYDMMCSFIDNLKYVNTTVTHDEKYGPHGVVTTMLGLDMSEKILRIASLDEEFVNVLYELFVNSHIHISGITAVNMDKKRMHAWVKPSSNQKLYSMQCYAGCTIYPIDWLEDVVYINAYDFNTYFDSAFESTLEDCTVDVSGMVLSDGDFITVVDNVSLEGDVLDEELFDAELESAITKGVFQTPGSITHIL
jgi:hypothetical protein